MDLSNEFCAYMKEIKGCIISVMELEGNIYLPGGSQKLMKTEN